MTGQQNGRRVHSKYRLVRILAIGFLAGIVFGMLLKQLDAGRQIDRAKETIADTQKKLEKENEQLKKELNTKKSGKNGGAAKQLASEKNWFMTLVNANHPLAADYVPELKEIEPEKSVDARIYDAAQEMLTAGREEGMQFYIASAYRSYEKQTEVYNGTMNDWMAQGRTPLEAYEETAKQVAVPGTSEHATGLALDITSGEYGELDEKQAETKEFKWLEENCWKYGFILRYPPEKSDITKIIYEPWHFRYVGKKAAKEITKQGVTLEEYLKAE